MTTQLNSVRHFDNQRVYDPTVEYSFVSFSVVSIPKWVRKPFLTLGEVKDALEDLPFVWSRGTWSQSSDKCPRLIHDFTDLRVYNESWLSELHKDWDEDSQSWKDSEYTNRQILFGQRYEDWAVLFAGTQSLSRQKDEDREQWLERVSKRRSSLKQSCQDRARHLSELSLSQREIRAELGLSV
jgi:hypothetical protein